jgi:hypothetical protein
MKDEHEKIATKIDDTFANLAAQFLISQSAVSFNQSGGPNGQTAPKSGESRRSP